ncbi:MAG: MoxR family ATPase [Planctomycetes bacterium]|nr:MoxR family ATPase [Planctomycetota bacterium]
MPEMTDIEAVNRLKDAADRLKNQMKKAIIGQEKVLEELLVCIFSKGHCLLVGVPGLAKTLMMRTLAQSLSLTFNRIQFTPDLMPSDITGTDIIQDDPNTSGGRCLQFIKGPVFANVILADEINRTPPKTQSALLEAMQELQVTAGGRKYLLEQPFFVMATQNPIEQEGTYPLPEAQLDRFMFNIIIDYPSAPEEVEIMKLTTSPFDVKLDKVLGAEEILKLQAIVQRVPVADYAVQYAMNLVRQTRVHQVRPEVIGLTAEGSEGTETIPDFIKQWVAWGAGPRASQYLITTARARAALQGRYFVTTDDIKTVALPVLRHRIIRNFTAEAEGITTDKIIAKLIEITPALESRDGRLSQVLESAGS